MNSPQYGINEDNKSSIVGFSFLSFFLLLMRLIPLDLIIDTEIAKIIVSKFIEFDADLVKVDN